MKKTKNHSGIAFALLVSALVAELAVSIFASDLTALVYGVHAILLGSLIWLGFENRKLLSGRTASFGIHSVMRVLIVLGIVGVVNFLGARHPLKHDFTQNKVNSLSDQTVKAVKGLKDPVKATFFAKMGDREQLRPLLQNYAGLNPNFKVEYVDPDTEPTRVKQLGIQRYNTLVLTKDGQNTKVEEPTEEKITNALIKLAKDKKQILCTILGHGEKSFESDAPDGYKSAKQGLLDQSYEIKTVEIIKEAKIPEDCTAVAVIGPSAAFFDAELNVLSDYLKNGGRALFALDTDLKGREQNTGLDKILALWHIEPKKAMIVDPLSRMLGVDASVPIVTTYSASQAITKDFKDTAYFAFSRPINTIPGAPEGLRVEWLAKSTPKAWAETNLKELAGGKVSYNAGTDIEGPVTLAVAAEGKLQGSNASVDSRIVVIGSSQFAGNNYARFGVNLDFFLNSVTWVMKDDSLISIRGKEDQAGKIELSRQQGLLIFWISVVLVPLLIAVTGIVIWWRRRRM